MVKAKKRPFFSGEGATDVFPFTVAGIVISATGMMIADQFSMQILMTTFGLTGVISVVMLAITSMAMIESLCDVALNIPTLYDERSEHRRKRE
jgi:hypothetical protein|tara:strand:+ start:844 stop:1122 length:279 start_codon:yes stop_codon:yes gene_type:complete